MDKNENEKSEFDIVLAVIKAISSLLYIGVIECCKKYKPLIVVYIVLVILMFIIQEVFFIFFLLAVGMGLLELCITWKERQKRKYFNRIFEKIEFYTKDEIKPYYLGEKSISPYASQISFKCLIPLKEWQKQKELLQTYMNVKIIEIKQDKDNYQKINLIIQNEILTEEINWVDSYINEAENILNIGVGYNGIVGMNLDKYPHAFVAGETGSGKSNILKCMIHQALLKNYDVSLVDFKRGVSFILFSDYIDVYYDYKSVLKVLSDAVKETNNRLDLFRGQKVDNLKDYNKIAINHLPHKIIFIDELAELLKTRDKELCNLLRDSLETLTRISRATGIHLIMGLQRPDSTIVSGQIKNNVPFRICGRFVDKEPSRIMIGNDKASTLKNIKGRFIVKDDNFIEVQAFYFTNDILHNYPMKKTIKATTESKACTNNIVKSHKVLIEPKKEPVKKVIPTEEKEIFFDFSDIKTKK